MLDFMTFIWVVWLSQKRRIIEDRKHPLNKVLRDMEIEKARLICKNYYENKRVF